MKYRKRPVVVEAVPISELIRNAGKNWAALPPWFKQAYEKGGVVITPERIFIKTLEGEMQGELTDMLIQGGQGELYPCKPDIFAATYEAFELGTEYEPFPNAA